MHTKDGVEVQAVYFPSPLGEDAAPAVLLHGWKSRGSELEPAAKFLNSEIAGRLAVLVPDLRGHGRSVSASSESGTPPPEAEAMRRSDFEKVVTQDLEAVKRFLVSEHNHRRLNIDRLCVIGVGAGSLLGAYWTDRDWQWPTLSGGRRQGKDVKVLVMISPPTGLRGLSMTKVVTRPSIRHKVAVQILCGGKGKGAAEARRIDAALKRAEGIKYGYDFREFDTSLQGSALLSQKTVDIKGYFASFIKAQAIDRMDDFRWVPRASVTREDKN